MELKNYNTDKIFDIPVVLFIFKRYDTVLRILERIEVVKPSKLYIIADGPRNEQEKEMVDKCRKKVEENITWDCEVVKNYADTNKGVYDRIGLGAKWVFSKEEQAIFLEDDNLPEVSFFYYCKELLNKYKDDTRIMWVCGTNYLNKYEPEDGSSYVFTQHLLPCGWASWSSKFCHYYDGDMELLSNNYIIKNIEDSYYDKRLYEQQIDSVESEYYRIKKENRPSSWDFQMAFSIRAHNVYGISPKYNQIENIGVDEFSTHGGTSFSNEMTKRFCGIKSFSLEFPLVHPQTVITDKLYERKIEKIILYPFKVRLRAKTARFIKKMFGLNKYEKFKFNLRK
ncbi:hypothetical protein ACQCT5_06925 [Sutcliffiella halmapala]